MNLVQIFFEQARRLGDKAGLKVKRDGVYVDISWSEWAENVEAVAGGLLSQGLQTGAKVALLSENRPEWTYADLAILACACADSPIYPTNRALQVEYIVKDSEAEFLFVSTAEQLEKGLAIIGNCPALKKIFVFDENTPKNLLEHEQVMSLTELMNVGREWLKDKEKAERLEATWQNIDAQDLATLIYTSGTTGDPKGVMLTHNNFVSNIISTSKCVRVDTTDIFLSHLPLSHVLERMSGYYLPIYNGSVIAYAESIEMVSQNMSEVHPTLMISVPRLFEKIYDRIYDGAQQSTGIKKQLAFWAFGVADQISACKREGRNPGSWLNLQNSLAKKLVFAKLGDKLGGSLRFFVSGGAPLPQKVAEFFYGTGYPIYEGYGLTETSPVMTANYPSQIKFGTVGRPIEGVEVKIAEDGEILTKGPSVTTGYYNNSAATAEAFVDGWFCTGDVGELDSDNYLKITDRKKDIIVTAGGKNIAPQHLENLLKTDKYITEVMLHGDRKKFISALLVPDFERVEAYALKNDILFTDIKGLLENPEIRAMLGRRIEKVQQEYDIPGYEQVKKFVVMNSEFTMDNNEVTPTLKLKRKIVTAKFQKELDALYED
ncbi:MAG: long-chain fatty acid--CoA ligase [Deltaproteobacteria bacterium]|nr:long-chain fatty acid--CoA ligase [Deltaproteobacteria bacterium]